MSNSAEMEKTKTRSNAKSRIIDAAFENFVAHGYEGASLSVIAEHVGIRKASIYTHFDSKDALFLELLETAFQLESEYLERCFNASHNETLPGEGYCLALKDRYLESIALRFLIRMAYVPTPHLLTAIQESYVAYIQILSDQLELAFQARHFNPEQIQLFSDAYLGIIDSLSVELLYGELFYERRLKAMLFLYRHSLAPESVIPL